MGTKHDKCQQSPYLNPSWTQTGLFVGTLISYIHGGFRFKATFIQHSEAEH